MRKVKRLNADIPDDLKPARIVQEESELRKYFLQSPKLRSHSRPPINKEIFYSESVWSALQKTFHSHVCGMEFFLDVKPEFSLKSIYDQSANVLLYVIFTHLDTLIALSRFNHSFFSF